MAYSIGDQCVQCGMCEKYCPVEAISAQNGAFAIDAHKCIECGTCHDLCPVNAISLLVKTADAPSAQ